MLSFMVQIISQLATSSHLTCSLPQETHDDYVGWLGSTTDRLSQGLQNMAGMGMEMEVSMPVLHAPVDTLRKGLTSLATETAEPHPVQTFQSTRKEREFAARIDTTARLYGVAAAMRLKTEKEIMSQVRRPPGLPSSMVALETVLGDDETVDFEDYMNDPLEKPDVPQMLIHDKMEQLLKM